MEPLFVKNDIRVFPTIQVALGYASRYCTGSTVIYRGQSNLEWDWKPTLFRITEVDRNMANNYTQNFIEAFVKEFSEYNGLTELQLLAIAQHYGFPTKMLDFTFNPIIAAYFAAGNKQGRCKYGEIAFVAPHEFQALKAMYGTTNGLTGMQIKAQDNYIGECQVVHVPGIPRIKRQEAVFVYDAQGGALRNVFLDRYGFVHTPDDKFEDPEGIGCTEYLFPEDDPIYEFVTKYDSSKQVPNTKKGGKIDWRRSMKILTKLFGWQHWPKHQASPSEETRVFGQKTNENNDQEMNKMDAAKKLMPLLEFLEKLCMRVGEKQIELLDVDNIMLKIPNNIPLATPIMAAARELKHALNNSVMRIDIWDECTRSIKNLLNEGSISRPNLGPHNTGTKKDWYDAAIYETVYVLMKFAHIEYVRSKDGDFVVQQAVRSAKTELKSAKNYTKWVAR